MSNRAPFDKVDIQIVDSPDPNALFDGIPYNPEHRAASENQLTRFQRMRELMIASVRMRDSRELNDASYCNERVLIAHYDKLYIDGNMITADYALQQAVESDYKPDQEDWFKIAEALEKRSTYTARVF